MNYHKHKQKQALIYILAGIYIKAVQKYAQKYTNTPYLIVCARSRHRKLSRQNLFTCLFIFLKMLAHLHSTPESRASSTFQLFKALAQRLHSSELLHIHRDTSLYVYLEYLDT